MVRRLLKAAVGTLAATILVGCQGDPRYGQYTRSQPKPEDLIGLWSLDVDASDWQSTGLAIPTPHTIELGPDGSAAVRNIPDVWDSDNRRVRGGYDTGVGTWITRKKQDFWTLELDLSEVNGKKPGRNLQLHLVGQTPPYQILAVIGDPDEGRALVFRKEQPAR